MRERIEAFQDRLGALFSKALLFLPAGIELDDVGKERVWKAVDEDRRYTKMYWVQMFLASLIAALGLLQNSVAVVIGAMLVAPLFRPMQVCAYAIANAQRGALLRNLKVLAVSTLLTIGTGFLVAVISPIKLETSEVLARVAPNFLDLLIAATSAAIAFLALSFRSLSASVAGVAMAASLVPPLATTGITIALGNATHAWGSFFLYITNLIAILVIGVFVFLLFGYRPHQEDDHKHAAQNLSLLLLSVLIISIPLMFSLRSIAQDIRFSQDAQKAFVETLATHIPQATLTEFIARRSHTEGILTVVLALPEEVILFAAEQAALSDELAEMLDVPIVLNMTLLRTASVQSQQEAGPTHTEQQQAAIRTIVRQTLGDMLPDIRIISLDVTALDTGQHQATTTFLVRSIIATPQASAPDVTALEEHIQARTADVLLSFTWLPVPLALEHTAPSPVELHRAFVGNTVASAFEKLFPEEASLEMRTVDWAYGTATATLIVDGAVSHTETFAPDMIGRYTISFDVFVPDGETETLLDALNVVVREMLGSDVTFSVRVIPITIYTL